MIDCDNKSPVGTNNTGFALNASGGTLFLFNSLTNGGGLIDSVAFGLQVSDFSIGRMPDGSGSWTLNLPTPDAFNTTAALDTASGLKINEWMASNPNGADWFELANLSPHPVSLGGLSFTKDLSTPTMSPIPPLSFIGAGASGFIQFFADKNPGADHVNFKLSKSGTCHSDCSPPPRWWMPSPSVRRPAPFPKAAFPMVTPTAFSSPNPTPAASNFLPLPGVTVNEVLTHALPPLEDAVEFYNSTASPVNIGGWFISNSQDDLKKYRIADNTTIPAQRVQGVL